MRVSFLIAGICAAIVVILLVNYWPEFKTAAGLTDPPQPAVTEPAVEPPGPPAPVQPPQVETTSVVPEPAQPVPEPEPEPALPELEASDAYVREQLTDVGLPAAWLQRQDLVARGSAVLANAASGKIPFRQLSYLVPDTAFPVTRIGDAYYLDRRGEQRYDGYVDMVTALPAQQAVALFGTLSPLFDQALAQLGERRGSRQLLIRAIETVQIRARHLPTLPDEVELVRPNLMYAYADPDLEALPDMDKLLLRMGPDNVQKLSVYLSEIKEFL